MERHFCFLASKSPRKFLHTVSIEVSPFENKCPNQPVTARCRVRKPVDSNTHLLLWQCDDDTGTNERVILCNNNPALELDCPFGTLYNISSACICDDTVIESEATFNTTSFCDMILHCSNGEEREDVSVSIKGDCIIGYIVIEIIDLCLDLHYVYPNNVGASYILTPLSHCAICGHRSECTIVVE